MPAPLEIHVPISPTPNFFNRIHYLAASLRRAGGLAAESSLVVTVGEDQEPLDLTMALPWSRKYPITWRWLDRELYRRQSFYATAVDRFRVDFASPVALMLDADMLVLKDFGDLVQRVQQEQAFCGAIAHISPFQADVAHPVPPEPPLDQRSAEEWWQAIFDRADLGTARFDCEHSGWNVLSMPTSRYCPALFQSWLFARAGGAIRNYGEDNFRRHGISGHRHVHLLSVPDRRDTVADPQRVALFRDAASLQFSELRSNGRCLSKRVAGY